MKYQQIQPPDFLKNHVRYFWTMDADDTDGQSYTFRTIADGGPGLLFQQPDKGIYYQNNKLLPGLFLYGQSTTHAALRLKGKFSTIGIHFYPHALKSVFGFDANELTDTCLDLNTMAERQGYNLSEQLSACSSVADKIEVLSSYLFFLVRKNSTLVDSRMNYALSQIIQSQGKIALKELQESLRLSERSIERKFKQYVGLSPKLFARICQFQASISQLRHNNYDRLSDIAYENEYADQSHLIRSFKEFAGVSPNHYQKQAEQSIENITDFSGKDPVVGFVLF